MLLATVAVALDGAGAVDALVGGTDRFDRPVQGVLGGFDLGDQKVSGIPRGFKVLTWRASAVNTAPVSPSSRMICWAAGISFDLPSISMCARTMAEAERMPSRSAPPCGR
ncbi:MAG: hypothetical protein U1E43_00575 [Rhodospirillales bacterium]